MEIQEHIPYSTLLKVEENKSFADELEDLFHQFRLDEKVYDQLSNLSKEEQNEWIQRELSQIESINPIDLYKLMIYLTLLHNSYLDLGGKNIQMKGAIREMEKRLEEERRGSHYLSLIEEYEIELRSVNKQLNTSLLTNLFLISLLIIIILSNFLVYLFL